MKIRLLLIAFFLLLGASVCSSQPISDRSQDDNGTPTTHTWLAVSLGPGTLFTRGAISASAHVSHQRDHNLYSIRVTRAEEMFSSLVEPRDPRPSETATEIAFLCGLAQGNAAHSSISVGLAFVDVQKRGAPIGTIYTMDYQAIRTHTVGLALDGQLFFLLPRFVALGLSLNADFNPSKSFGAIMLSIYLGDI